MDAFLATILLFAGNYPPYGWAFCNGQLLQISAYNALFAVIGTTYGGDGIKTFALPDLRGRVPVGFGQGVGLPNIAIGSQFGSTTNTLTVAQLPSHNHALLSNSQATGRALATVPTANYPACNQDTSGNYATTSDGFMNPAVIGSTGGNIPVNNLQPSLGLNYIICLQGIFPSKE